MRRQDLDNHAFVKAAGLGRVAVLASGLALLTAAAAAPALAETETREAAQERFLVQSEADFSREQLEAFAIASLRVEEINKEWMPQIAEAESTEESEELRSQAIEEMTGAVRDEGLTVETYNQIYDAVERNPEIASVVEDYRREHQ